MKNDRLRVHFHHLFLFSPYPQPFFLFSIRSETRRCSEYRRFVMILHNFLFSEETVCVFKMLLVDWKEERASLENIRRRWRVGPPSWDVSGCVRATAGGGERERAWGREEGHTHEPTVHPASGPHLELDTASPRAGRGDFRGKKHSKRRREKALCVFRQGWKRCGTSSEDLRCCKARVQFSLTDKVKSVFVNLMHRGKLKDWSWSQSLSFSKALIELWCLNETPQKNLLLSHDSSSHHTEIISCFHDAAEMVERFLVQMQQNEKRNLAETENGKILPIISTNPKEQSLSFRPPAT